MKINNTKQLSYKDISLIPKKCIVDSRRDVKTTINLNGYDFVMPVCASNMKSVVDIETCQFFAKNKWFYIMHRFDGHYMHFMSQMKIYNYFTSISVGINEESINRLDALSDAKYAPDFITIDVANAWSKAAMKMVKKIRKKFPNVFLIAGNVATGEAVEEIEKWGVDAIKCGLAGGSVCITKNKTGIHRPMVSTVLECAQARKKVLLIADGGIVEHGDIAKALVCGADMVMAGSLFAGYEQSAGNIIEIEDNMYKEYYGSASKYNKEDLKNIEGKKILIKFKGDMNRLLKELREDLQSSISYLGCNDVKDIKGIDFYLL